jgi:hypothetical protein
MLFLLGNFDNCHRDYKGQNCHIEVAHRLGIVMEFYSFLPVEEAAHSQEVLFLVVEKQSGAF